ncbi:E3 ubiquitin-protein ligase listerin [Oratosquilla oratoria]|uniref:E3 ubiquitin-protein ligase listerin n=1 Tax=Oratosquilla oratoria TaxID=337810 RepID=UPI003F75995E
MGKDRNAQRTKGNLKPSSSGRSAELLGGVTGFIGFSALSDLGYVPAAAQGLEDDTAISGQFRMTMRKMSKKDATTRIKALQEFEGLCSTEDIEAVKSALPFWPRIYSKITIDVERRVREAAQVSHAALVNQVGKQLAPYLRFIMPSWVMAMVDPYVPASTAALKAFESTFPEDKRAGVMVYCCKEIMNYCQDNLFNQTANTLSDAKNTAPEDMESKYIRVLSSSISSISLLLKLTANVESKKGEVIKVVQPVINNPKFWCLAKHKSPLVRSAWFTIIKNVFEFDVEIIRPQKSELCKVVISALDDQDGMVLSHVWVVFLYVSTQLPEVWQEELQNNSRSIYGRVYAVLRDGCRGSAMELGPQLLPILSVLPSNSDPDKCKLYTDFLHALTTGIRKDRILVSSRELSALLKALYECMTYISKGQRNDELWQTLVKYQIVELVKSSLKEMPQLSSSVLYSEVSNILRFWVQSPHSIKDGKPMSDLVTLFWETFIPEGKQLLEEENEAVFSRMEKFLCIVQDPSSHKAKRSGGIKFQDESQLPEKMEGLKLRSESISKQETEFLELIAYYVTPLVFASYQLYQKTENPSVYKLFACVLFCFPSGHMLKALLNKTAEPSERIHGQADEETCLAVMEDLVMPKMETDDPALVHPTLQIFLSIYKQLTCEHRNDILVNLKHTSASILRRLIESMTEFKDDVVASRWLSSPQLGCRLVKLAQQLCAMTVTMVTRPESSTIKAQQSELLKLMKFVLTLRDEDELFSREYISQIITTLRMTLPNPAGSALPAVKGSAAATNEVVCMVCALANCIYSNPSCWDITGTQELLRALFQLLCQPCKEMTVNTIEELKSTFTNAFQQLVQVLVEGDSDKLMEESGFVMCAMQDIKKFILGEHCSYTTAVALSRLTKSLLQVVYNCLNTSDDCSILLDHSHVQHILDVILPTEGEWLELEGNLSPLYVAPGILQGTMAFQEFPLPRSLTQTVLWNHSYSRLCLLITDLLVYLCSPAVAQSESTTDVEAQETVSLGRYIHVVGCLLHATCHTSSLCILNDNLNNEAVSQDVRMGINTLKAVMGKLLAKINIGNKRLIAKQIRDRCLQGSSSWCVTLGQVLTHWFTEQEVRPHKLFSEVEDNSLGIIPTKQILLPFLKKEMLVDMLNEEVGKLASLGSEPFLASPTLALLASILGLLDKTVTKEAIGCIMMVLTQWREEANEIFLFSTDISGRAWEEVALTCSIVRVVTVLIKHHSLHVEEQHWDFLLCSLSAWIQSLEESNKNVMKETVIGTFTCAICKLVGCISEIIYKMKDNPDLQNCYPQSLSEEWKEFFSSSIYNTLLPLFVEATDQYKQNPSIMLYGVCRSICIGVNNAGTQELQIHSLRPLFVADDASEDLKLPDSEQILMNYLSPMLLSTHPPTQFTAYKLLGTVLPHIMTEWEKNDIPVDENEDTPQRPLPYALTRIVKSSSEVVETALAEYEMGAACEVVPHTDAYSYTAGYLMAWSLVLDTVTHTSDTNQLQYSMFLRESDLLPSLLYHLFQIMPSKPVLKEGQQDEKTQTTMFNTTLHIGPLVAVTSDLIAWLACRVYYACVRVVPAAVRLWWNNLDRKAQQLVDKFTMAYVSPQLIMEEITAVGNSTTKFNNMTIKARVSAREVVATYTIDEASMELVIRLAPNHPLGAVTVEDRGRVGVSVAQWRNWLFGLTTMLSHRNTPLLQSLVFWKCNVDQRFEGVEECYICYYVLHGANHQLPRLLCRTCKKKFHSACLYKWFNTSNNSTCPLCRSLF